MARHPKPSSPAPPPRPPPESDPGPVFDPVEEWLIDFDPTMSAELETKSVGPAEEVVLLHPLETTPTCDDAGKVLDGSAAPNSCEFGSEEVPAEENVSVGQAGIVCGEEIDRKAEMVTGGLDELLAPDPDQLLAAGIGDLAVKDDVSEGAVAMEMAAAPADVEVDTALSVKEEESSDEESESSEESSEASSSSDDEEEESKEEDESSEASSSHDDEELGAKKHGGAKGDSMEALLEEGELMVGSDNEEDVPKGPIKSKNEAEVLPPVPKIEIQLEPHHQTLPVGIITAIMGERVIVEGSVQHSPLNEGSILWITESRAPLGIVDELFGPVKNPYYLVRYNSEEEVPAGISAGTSVSFVAEFADHILNVKELCAKGYDASGDNDEELTDEPEFSDDEKEAEYKRSLRQAKRQSERQHEPKKNSDDKKRPHPRDAGFRKDMPPRNRDTPTPGHQSQPRFPRPVLVPAAAANAAPLLGPQDMLMSAPTMMPAGPMNSSMPSPVHLANQMGGSFVNPAQQFLPQHPNMMWPGGLPPMPNLNMGPEGAALAANIMQNLLAGANQFQQQFQNQNFSGFPNQLPMPFPQFLPQTRMPANPMLFGGPPMNSPFGAASQLPMGQGNFGQPPAMSGDRQEQGHSSGLLNSQGFGSPAPTHGDGDQQPTQFNSGQFNQGSSSFRGGRRHHQRGGRHSPGRRGGRGGRHHR
ncbi:hypothetical protein QOZ80_5AG0367570 [Eleusine coracana subsp. coracana]|nr:hypothetical protein QOZ80_5AG0367570 [Eleusine coracana subsp. coracana]